MLVNNIDKQLPFCCSADNTIIKLNFTIMTLRLSKCFPKYTLLVVWLTLPTPR